jgi:hypothetical protein
MEIIKQNPYRVLGLLANSKERKIQKQISVINRFLEVGKSKTFEYDFKVLGDLKRDIEIVQEAASKIEQVNRKIEYALFWFVESSNFDELAISHLIEGNKEKATDLWERTLKESVTTKNISSYQNISTIYMASAIVNGQLDLKLFRKGLDLKGKMFSSDYACKFFEIFLDEGLVVDQESIVKTFVDNVILNLERFLGRNKIRKAKTTINLFSSYPDYVKKYVLGKYLDEPIKQLETKVEECKIKRKNNNAQSDVIGTKLYSSSKDQVELLKELLGKTDIKYQMAVDNLADEIMQCSINYFNEWRDSEINDPGERALQVADLAKSLEPAGRVKQRIDDNYNIIKEWVDDLPERKLQERISGPIDEIMRQINLFDESAITRELLRKFLVNTKPKLNEIKNILGSSDEFYLKICDGVVSRVRGGIVEIFNTSQQDVINGNLQLQSFKIIVESLTRLGKDLLAYDMTDEVRRKIREDMNTISSTEIQVDNAIKKASGGCYIATMAYGDYDHPQVVRLRKYRDEVISKSFAGRGFIKIYYMLSPKLVCLLKDATIFNTLIRAALDKLIKVIDK